MRTLKQILLKRNILFIYLISMGSTFVFNCYSQKNKNIVASEKMDSSNKAGQKIIAKDVKEYHVEENINMKFGGYTTTYVVTDSSLVNKYDLGPNNTRVVTQQYKKKIQVVDVPNEKTIEMPKTVQPLNDITIPNITTPNINEKHNGIAYIYMIKTYQRIADKGYKSVEIFRKLGNAYYYNSEMEKAVKCYIELFAMTTDLEPEYYYRYAQSLRSIGKNDKANEMLEKYNLLSKKNTR